jgi:hypothetical protein
VDGGICTMVIYRIISSAEGVTDLRYCHDERF